MNITALQSRFSEPVEFLLAGALNGDLLVTMIGTIDEPGHEKHDQMYELRTHVAAKLVFDPSYDMTAFLETHFKDARYHLTAPTITATRWLTDGDQS